MSRSHKKYDRGNILFRLGYLTRRWRQLLDTEVQAAGLTDATWRPLLHLHLLGDGIRQKEQVADFAERLESGLQTIRNRGKR